jgi:2-amino-4-hydroxy-6-hydroxymethyldihydropteridine diphosphokinase
VEKGYLSIGANMGDREASVLRAVRLIDDQRTIYVVKSSSLYQTSPVACPPQPFFINMVIEVITLLSPMDLLKRIKAIEGEMGRVGAQNEPRKIDIDIVTLGQWIIKSADLSIPHPRYSARRFVLIPLREIAPDFRCPLRGKGLDELINDLSGQGEVELVSSRKLIMA